MWNSLYNSILSCPLDFDFEMGNGPQLSISKYRADSKGKREYGNAIVEGEKKSLPLDDFIEVGFFDVNGDVIAVKKVRVGEIESELSFTFDEEVGRIEIDPNYLLMDVERGDGVWGEGIMGI